MQSRNCVNLSASSVRPWFLVLLQPSSSQAENLCRRLQVRLQAVSQRSVTIAYPDLTGKNIRHLSKEKTQWKAISRTKITSIAWTNLRFPPRPDKSFLLAAAHQTKFFVPSPASSKIVFSNNWAPQEIQKSSQSQSGKMNRLSHRPNRSSRSTTRK